MQSLQTAPVVQQAKQKREPLDDQKENLQSLENGGNIKGRTSSTRQPASPYALRTSSTLNQAQKPQPKYDNSPSRDNKDSLKTDYFKRRSSIENKDKLNTDSNMQLLSGQDAHQRPQITSPRRQVYLKQEPQVGRHATTMQYSPKAMSQRTQSQGMPRPQLQLPYVQAPQMQASQMHPAVNFRPQNQTQPQPHSPRRQEYIRRLQAIDKQRYMDYQYQQQQQFQHRHYEQHKQVPQGIRAHSLGSPSKKAIESPKTVQQMEKELDELDCEMLRKRSSKGQGNQQITQQVPDDQIVPEQGNNYEKASAIDAAQQDGKQIQGFTDEQLTQIQEQIGLMLSEKNNQKKRQSSDTKKDHEIKSYAVQTSPQQPKVKKDQLQLELCNRPWQDPRMPTQEHRLSDPQYLQNYQRDPNFRLYENSPRKQIPDQRKNSRPEDFNYQRQRPEEISSQQIRNLNTSDYPPGYPYHDPRYQHVPSPRGMHQRQYSPRSPGGRISMPPPQFAEPHKHRFSGDIHPPMYPQQFADVNKQRLPGDMAPPVSRRNSIEQQMIASQAQQRLHSGLNLRERLPPQVALYQRSNSAKSFRTQHYAKPETQPNQRQEANQYEPMKSPQKKRRNSVRFALEQEKQPSPLKGQDAKLQGQHDKRDQVGDSSNVLDGKVGGTKQDPDNLYKFFIDQTKRASTGRRDSQSQVRRRSHGNTKQEYQSPKQANNNEMISNQKLNSPSVEQKEGFQLQQTTYQKGIKDNKEAQSPLSKLIHTTFGGMRRSPQDAHKRPNSSLLRSISFEDKTKDPTLDGSLRKQSGAGKVEKSGQASQPQKQLNYLEAHNINEKSDIDQVVKQILSQCQDNSDEKGTLEVRSLWKDQLENAQKEQETQPQGSLSQFQEQHQLNSRAQAYNSENQKETSNNNSRRPSKEHVKRRKSEQTTQIAQKEPHQQQLNAPILQDQNKAYLQQPSDLQKFHAFLQKQQSSNVQVDPEVQVKQQKHQHQLREFINQQLGGIQHNHVNKQQNKGELIKNSIPGFGRRNSLQQSPRNENRGKKLATNSNSREKENFDQGLKLSADKYKGYQNTINDSQSNIINNKYNSQRGNSDLQNKHDTKINPQQNMTFAQENQFNQGHMQKIPPKNSITYVQKKLGQGVDSTLNNKEQVSPNISTIQQRSQSDGQDVQESNKQSQKRLSLQNNGYKQDQRAFSVQQKQQEQKGTEGSGAQEKTGCKESIIDKSKSVNQTSEADQNLKSEEVYSDESSDTSSDSDMNGENYTILAQVTNKRGANISPEDLNNQIIRKVKTAA